MSRASQKQVQAWKARKAQRAMHPLDRAGAATETVARRATGCHATASVGGTVVARSANAQLANRRVYFPLEDCNLRHFERSAKRWR